jgi:exoribonuclease II
MLQQLDEPNRYLPPAIADLRIDEWDKIRDYFVNVAHHSREATNEEFAGWQDTLERFLLDRLKPRTFVDFDMIDEIIREGENDAGR